MRQGTGKIIKHLSHHQRTTTMMRSIEAVMRLLNFFIVAGSHGRKIVCCGFGKMGTARLRTRKHDKTEKKNRRPNRCRIFVKRERFRRVWNEFFNGATVAIYSRPDWTTTGVHKNVGTPDGGPPIITQNYRGFRSDCSTFRWSRHKIGNGHFNKVLMMITDILVYIGFHWNVSKQIFLHEMSTRKRNKTGERG